MSFWDQIASYPALTIGPALTAAVVSGVISISVARGNRKATSADVDRKIDAERDSTDRKIASERSLTDTKLDYERERLLSDRAWNDYGLRRDMYFQLVERIDYMFAGNHASFEKSTVLKDSTDPKRKAFHETARKVRLIGSDEVVDALNSLTSAIKSGQADVAQQLYSELMNAIRVDIRTLNEKPPVGTKLGVSSFPIES